MGKKKAPVDVDPDLIPRKVGRNGIGTHGQKRVEWEPSARQWAIYDAVRRGGSYRNVGAQFEMTFQNVGAICQRIDQYLSQLYFDSVREIRVRHTEYLENIFSEAMEAWEKSKGIGVTITTEDVSINSGRELESMPGTKTTRKEVHQCGAPAFLNEARGALADIRKIHGVDRNPKIREEGDDDSDGRVAGKDRESLIKQRIASLNASLKASQAVRGTVANSDQAG